MRGGLAANLKGYYFQYKGAWFYYSNFSCWMFLASSSVKSWLEAGATVYVKYFFSYLRHFDGKIVSLYTNFRTSIFSCFHIFLHMLIIFLYLLPLNYLHHETISVISNCFQKERNQSKSLENAKKSKRFAQKTAEKVC